MVLTIVCGDNVSLKMLHAIVKLLLIYLIITSLFPKLLENLPFP